MSLRLILISDKISHDVKDIYINKRLSEFLTIDNPVKYYYSGNGGTSWNIISIYICVFVFSWDYFIRDFCTYRDNGSFIDDIYIEKAI